MSRSYKKTPISKDHNKGMKNAANRKVRKSAVGLPNGSSYKKVFESYDICDWAIKTTKTEYRKSIIEDVLRGTREDKKYFLDGLDIKDIENVDLYNISLQELNKKIDYRRWLTRFYYK